MSYGAIFRLAYFFDLISIGERVSNLHATVGDIETLISKIDYTYITEMNLFIIRVLILTMV